jgi:hypothetical protein
MRFLRRAAFDFARHEGESERDQNGNDNRVIEIADDSSGLLSPITRSFAGICRHLSGCVVRSHPLQ